MRAHEELNTRWSEARLKAYPNPFSPLTVLAELLAVAAAPFGAVPRALLALHFNKPSMNRLRLKYSGTLVANAIGTFIAAGVATVSVLEDPSAPWLFALSDGLAGSLSTVSTFVGEVEGEEEGGKNAGYMLATICVTSLSAITAIFGFSQSAQA